MRVLRILPTVIVLFVFLQAKTHAQESWEIEEYNTDISIKNTGDVAITEDIFVNFGPEQKHGIYRDIPYEYEDSGGETYYTEVTVLEVLMDKEKIKYELIRENGNLRIKIGDPDETISGKHVYQIDYNVKGVLQGFADYDELYWNAIGSSWAVPINKAQARVTLPKDGVKNFACFIGVSGSKEICKIESVSGKEVVFNLPRVLLPYEGFTVATDYTKGMEPLLTAVRPKNLFERFIEPSSLLLFFGIATFAVIAVVILWYRQGRDFWYKNVPYIKSVSSGELKPVGGHETVVVEYEPPEKLRPAQIGVLVDEIAHTHDVTSTIVDLATRGYLLITEIEKKWKFGKNDYEFKRKANDTKGLLEYEKLLLSHLFKTGDRVKMSELKQTFYDELTEVKKKLYEDVVQKGYFQKDPERTRNIYMVSGILGIVLGIILIIIGINLDSVPLIDLALGFLTGAVTLIIISRFMPRKTAKGRDLYRRIKGYRLFISSVETHRQRFFEKKNMFNQVLPYAMVFELTNKYIKALGDLELQKETSSWYRGTTVFSMGSFSSSMNNFSSTVGTAISSVPKSSGSSGGGFSGGGFGGGGGGSW